MKIFSYPRQFLRESYGELKKVSWPTRQDTIKYTLAVILMSVAMSIFLGAADLGLVKLLETFINR